MMKIRFQLNKWSAWKVDMVGRTFLKLLYPLATLLTVLVIWQVAVSSTHTSVYVLPGPLAIYHASTKIGVLVLESTPPTLYEILVGFGLAVIVGVPLGILLAAFKFFERSTFPLIVGIQGIPKVALAPIFMVWFGFGYMPKVLLALSLAFFPIVVATMAGVRSVNPAYITLGLSMQGSRRNIYRKIMIPNALPHIFAGFKVGMSLAIIGAVVGELMGSNHGLGYVLVSATGQLQIDRAFVVILWLAVISIPLVQSVSWIERLIIPWSPHSRNNSL